RERLQRALQGLDQALADQRMAIAAWRRAIGELHSTVAGLGGSLERHRGSLDGLATRVEGLHQQAVQLARAPDLAMVIASDGRAADRAGYSPPLRQGDPSSSMPDDAPMPPAVEPVPSLASIRRARRRRVLTVAGIVLGCFALWELTTSLVA